MNLTTHLEATEANLASIAASDSFQLRILEIFEYVACHGPVTLSSTAAALELPKSSVSRCLSKLQHQGWITRGIEDSSFFVSPAHRRQVNGAISFTPALFDVSRHLKAAAMAQKFSFALYARDSAGETRTLEATNTSLGVKDLSERDTFVLDQMLGHDLEGPNRLPMLGSIHASNSSFNRQTSILCRDCASTQKLGNSVLLPIVTQCGEQAAIRLVRGVCVDFAEAINTVSGLIVQNGLSWMNLDELLARE